MKNTITIDFPGLSLLEVRSQFNKYFYTKENAWYEKEEFAKEKIAPGKYEVDLEAVPESFSKTYREQEQLLTSGCVIPPIAVLVYAMIQNKIINDKYAFSDTYVRTSSLDSDGRRVLVGNFDAYGLRVNRYWDDDRGSGLGVASARKLNIESLGVIDPSDILTLENRVKVLEKWRERVQMP